MEEQTFELSKSCSGSLASSSSSGSHSARESAAPTRPLRAESVTVTGSAGRRPRLPAPSLARLRAIMVVRSPHLHVTACVTVLRLRRPGPARAPPGPGPARRGESQTQPGSLRLRGSPPESLGVSSGPRGAGDNAMVIAFSLSDSVTAAVTGAVAPVQWPASRTGSKWPGPTITRFPSPKWQEAEIVCAHTVHRRTQRLIPFVVHH